MAQEQDGLVENVFKLLDMLPPEFKSLVVIALLIGGGIWWWRKNSEEKEPSNQVEQKTKGKQSPAINDVQGNVTINYGKKDEE